MRSTGLRGPYALNNKSIDDAITAISAGAYALGHSSDGKFQVDFVGRSQGDLNDRLKDWVGCYTEFKFVYCDTAYAAFQEERLMYHGFSPIDNIHPARPAGSNWTCPHCGTFEQYPDQAV